MTGHYSDPHFTEEKTETQSDEVTLPRSPRKTVETRSEFKQGPKAHRPV